MKPLRHLTLRPLRSWCLHCSALFLLLPLATSCAAPPNFTKHVIDPDFPAIAAAAVDVDGDGMLDVVASGGPSGGKSEWSNLVRWYRAPAWEMSPVVTMQEGAIILHMERVNYLGEAGQAVPQVSVTDGHFGEIWWCRYDRAESEWIKKAVVNDVKYCHGTASGDIDRDGYEDLLVPFQPTRERRGVLWARNPGASAAEKTNVWTKFDLAPEFDIEGWLHYVRLRDVNGDGRLDALLGSGGRPGWFGVWYQPEDPKGTWDVRVLEGPMRRGTNLDAADLNGDGLTDLVGSEGHATGLWTFMAPDFVAQRLDTTLTNAHCLALGDFDGNGAVDVASCGYGNRRVACFLNDSHGRFRPLVLDTNQCAYDAVAVDLDQDGDQDILLSGQKSGNLVWYENLRIDADTRP